MYVSNVCDFCACEPSGSDLIHTVIEVATYFDVVFENPDRPPTIQLKGKWCSEDCIRKHIDYCAELAARHKQSKIDNDEDTVRIARQMIRDDQAKASWELQQSKELRLVKAMKRLRSSVAESYRLLRVRYCRAMASWRSIDT